jgi:hypothetical protein
MNAGAGVAFLGLAFIDTSTEGAYFGVREDETERLHLMEEAVRERFVAEGLALVDIAPISGKLSAIANPADCHGCEVRMGEDLGADYVLVGEVQKVSNLIISMNLVVRDVATGQMVGGQSVDVRSNTDDSWLRGIRYIMDHSIFNGDKDAP